MMRPRRASVWGDEAPPTDVAGARFRGAELMARLSSKHRRWAIAPHAYLGSPDAEAEIDRRRRVRKRAHGDEIHASFGVGANVLKIDSAGAFKWYAAVGFRAALYRSANVLGSHVVEENGLASIS